MTSAIKRPETEVYGIDLLNMNPAGVDHFVHGDFIEFYTRRKLSPLLCDDLPSPDIIIANPPYNCHETEYIRKHKRHLREVFGRHATLNMYSLFLTAIIDLAAPGTAIGVIVHDSFLTARGHETLRRMILSECTIRSLHLCPTDLFLDQGAEVRTCILILEKGLRNNKSIDTSNRPTTKKEFSEILACNKFEVAERSHLCLESDRDRSEFLVGVPRQIRELFSESRIGDQFPCITGISTGNDKAYLSSERTEEFKYPFYKNPGSRRFFSGPDAYLATNFIQISSDVPNFIVRNKEFLFRGGLSCSSMGVAFGAAVLPDQSTYGVNANIVVDGPDKWWLLSFLNSGLCTYIVRGAMLRSNMITAGYVSRIPVPRFSNQAKVQLGTLAKEAYEMQIAPSNAQFYIRSIDLVICKDLGLDHSLETTIRDFCDDVVRRS